MPSIQQVARAAGVSSRTLRHYDALGLLVPSRTEASGRRWYDDDALVRLQQILLLRELGLPLAQVRAVLDAQVDEAAALAGHLHRLRAEQHRLARQAAAVERTIAARTRGAPMDAQDMFDGFDHTRYRQEVADRWGQETADASETWWQAMTPEQQDGWKEHAAALVTAWREAADAGVAPGSTTAQDLAVRHLAWLASVPGTPRTGQRPAREYVLALADMYVADERFTRTYGGPAGARLVRDAVRLHVAGTWGAAVPEPVDAG